VVLDVYETEKLLPCARAQAGRPARKRIPKKTGILGTLFVLLCYEFACRLQE
jgi:hypothetical protein